MRSMPNSSELTPSWLRAIPTETPHASSAAWSSSTPRGSRCRRRSGHLRALPRPFRTVWLGIAWEHARLYERINRRAEWMWTHGLVEETQRVLAMGFGPDCPGLNTHGYKECVAYIRGELTAQQALALMQRRTRQYAKRQLSWFRRYEHIHWLAGDAPERLAQACYELLARQGVLLR
jgi:tRNA A37 N6-isopentenylltransferase MiaA